MYNIRIIVTYSLLSKGSMVPDNSSHHTADLQRTERGNAAYLSQAQTK
jgi:hypothetical protein